MYQRVIFGEVSDFLSGLGSHLTDVTPVEVLTLAPLVGLTLLLGLFPGLVLHFINTPVDTVLAQLSSATTGMAP